MLDGSTNTASDATVTGPGAHPGVDSDLTLLLFAVVRVLKTLLFEIVTNSRILILLLFTIVYYSSYYLEIFMLP